MNHKIPTSLQYTATHEWLRAEDDGAVTIGITDHAQNLLGDIVYVELPEAQKNVRMSDSCAVIESVKAAADVYTPITGMITAVNTQLSANPELINVDPYGDGWLCRIMPADKTEMSRLLSAEAYQHMLESE